MAYGIGEADGMAVTDVVSMGPVSNTDPRYRMNGGFVVAHQEFMLASSLSGGSFTQTRFDGVMGLSQGGEVGTPWYLNLRDAGQLERAWMSLFYSNTDSKPGQLIFGGVDEALYTGQISWHPSGPSFPFYWTTTLSRIEVGGHTVFSCDSGQVCEAMLDSGTSLIVAPTSWLGSSVSSFSVGNDCSGLATLPDFTVHLSLVGGGTAAYTLSGSDYTLQRQGSCAMGVAAQSAQSTDGTIILGDVFIRKFYTIFDFSDGPSNGHIGLADANQAGNAAR